MGNDALCVADLERCFVLGNLIVVSMPFVGLGKGGWLTLQPCFSLSPLAKPRDVLPVAKHVS